MKILHITETMGQGGAERHLANLFKHLQEEGTTNTLVTLWPGVAYQEQLSALSSFTCLNLKGRNILSGLPRVLRMARQADVIHTQLFWADLLGRLAGALAGRPIFTTLQTTVFDDQNLAKQPFTLRQKLKLLRLLDLLTSRLVTQFFSVSKATRSTYARIFRLTEERFELLYNTVDLSKFNPDIQGDRAAIRAQLGVRPEETLLFSTARLVSSKRLDDAIRAVKELSQRSPIRMFIAGSGPCEEELRALVRELDAPVQLLGARDDIPRLLYAADLFVFPSLFEGLPLALIEAMAMGLPCVCSNIPENQEVCGEAAVYFPPTDVPAMVQEIEALLRSKATQKVLSEKARATAKRFDAEAIAKQFIQSIQAHLR
jgi:glycosyltransferase involved in cell wall biosynthesis